MDVETWMCKASVNLSSYEKNNFIILITLFM